MSDKAPSPQSVVVPVEPTDAMHYAGDRMLANAVTKGGSIYDTTKAMWSAMLAAAPAPSSLAGGERERVAEIVEDAVLRHNPSACVSDTLDDADAILAALSPEAPAREGGTFQDRCGAWLDVCFGPESRADIPHRNARFLEEAVELVQAAGMDESAAVDVVRYVFTRPQGDINQEVGGVMMTLAAHCLATGVDMGTAAEAELTRVWTKVDAIRKKEAAKPTFAAPTPRHEAPADPCASHRSMGFHIDPCGPHCEAPAEGAGEARDRLIEVLKRMDDGVYASLNDQADAVISALILQPKDPAEVGAEVASAARALLDACYKADENSDLSDFVDGMLLTRLDKALRARSSAPEAREEALGNLLAVIHGDGGHRALEVGTKQAALEAEKIVAGLFAAPSADKLLEVDELVSACEVEFCSPGTEGQSWTYGEDDDSEVAYPKSNITFGHIRRARQALAALKAEG